MKYIISVPTKLVFSFLFLFSQKLRSWVFNDQPRRECAVVGLNGSFPAAGGGDLGKKGIAESDCLFPLSKIAHWSILLRGNGGSPGYCRSGGTDPILSTQTIPRGRAIWAIFMKIVVFMKENEFM